MSAFFKGRDRSPREPDADKGQAGQTENDAINDQPTLEQLHQVHQTSIENEVPRSLRVAAAWSWRLLLVAAVIMVMWHIGGILSEVVVPMAAALLLTAILMPLNLFLRRHSFPHWLAALSCLLVLVVVIVGLLTLVGAQIVTQWGQLADRAIQGQQQLLTWLGNGPLHIDHQQITNWINQGRTKLVASQNQIASIIAETGSSIGRFLAGVAMALFATFFFLKNGSQYADSITNALPPANRVVMRPALRGGWASLVGYVKAAVVVALCDGVGAGLGALILGSNLWLAILVLTFVCAFIPLVGAIFAGVVAVAVTLVTLGFWKAIIMLVVFVAVIQLEGHVMQPLLLGHAAKIPPLVVLVGIAAGIILAGIEGGVFAIPAVAFISGFFRAIHKQHEQLENGSLPGFTPVATSS